MIKKENVWRDSDRVEIAGCVVNLMVWCSESERERQIERERCWSQLNFSKTQNGAYGNPSKRWGEICSRGVYVCVCVCMYVTV